jgi:hypothetical protein
MPQADARASTDRTSPRRRRLKACAAGIVVAAMLAAGACNAPSPAPPSTSSAACPASLPDYCSAHFCPEWSQAQDVATWCTPRGGEAPDGRPLQTDPADEAARDIYVVQACDGFPYDTVRVDTVQGCELALAYGADGGGLLQIDETCDLDWACTAGSSTVALAGRGGFASPCAGTSFECPGFGAADAGLRPQGWDAGCGCEAPLGTLHPTPTAASFRALFGREWRTCAVPGISGLPNEAGFKADANGNLTIRVFDAAGNVVDGPHGTYTVEPNQPSVWQVNVYGTIQADAGTVAFALLLATITDSPEMLALQGQGGGEVPAYAPVVDWPDAGTACPASALGVYEPPAACAAPTSGTLSLSDMAAVTSLLAQSWLLCSPAGVGTTSPSQAGIVIRADGTYSVLVVDSSGALVEATGIDDVGTWNIPFFSPGSNVFQLDFRAGGPGTFILQASFSESPLELLLNNEGVYKYDYIQAPPGAGTDAGVDAADVGDADAADAGDTSDMRDSPG